jgi:hypothetical protein
MLDDGGAFVGWGGVRKVTEFTPAGTVRFEAKLPYGDTYRGYRLPWVGHPTDRPSIGVDGNRVYASWNGKTGLARWEVLVGDDPSQLSRIATKNWTGLETMIPLENAPAYAAVRALDSDGHPLGDSATVKP